MIGHWLGWVSFAVCILLLSKVIGRISKSQKFNLALRKIHKPFGIAVIVIGTIHGILCFTDDLEFSLEVVTGIVLLLCIIALARTFYARKKLKAKWFQMHRHLSIALLIIMVVHIIFAVV